MESHPDAREAREMLLASRDQLVLRWLGEQYAARVDHLQVLLGKGFQTAYKTASRLRDDGLIQTRTILVGEPMWVIPTLAGLSACGLTYSALLPKWTRLAHLAAINDVRLHIQGRSAETRWVSERRLLSEGSFKEMGHVPDGLAIYEGRRVAIEVEISLKTTHWVTAKLDAHERRYDVTVYFCAQKKPFRQLTRLAESGRWPNLEVRELPDLGVRPSPRETGDRS